MRVKAGHFAAKKRNRSILKLSKCIIKAITNSVECGRSVRKLLTSQLIGHNQLQHQHRQYTREPYRLPACKCYVSLCEGLRAGAGSLSYIVRVDNISETR